MVDVDVGLVVTAVVAEKLVASKLGEKEEYIAEEENEEEEEEGYEICPIKSLFMLAVRICSRKLTLL